MSVLASTDSESAASDYEATALLIHLQRKRLIIMVHAARLAVLTVLIAILLLAPLDAFKDSQGSVHPKTFYGLRF